MHELKPTIIQLVILTDAVRYMLKHHFDDPSVFLLFFIVIFGGAWLLFFVSLAKYVSMILSELTAV